jgi:hypothetical protein
MSEVSTSTQKEKLHLPSPFGSHGSMIEEELTNMLADKTFVVLKDENGLYLTEKARLDDHLADPNRYASPEYRKAKLVEAGISGQNNKGS